MCVSDLEKRYSVGVASLQFFVQFYIDPRHMPQTHQYQQPGYVRVGVHKVQNHQDLNQRGPGLEQMFSTHTMATKLPFQW